jgi:peptide/nickel transport system permease protein
VNVSPQSAAPAGARSWHLVPSWIRADVRTMISFGFLLVMALVALFPWLFAPYSPLEQDLMNTLAAPTWSHPMGTDDLGRDLFSRLVWGARPSLYATALAVGLAAAIGIPVGLTAGFLGGVVANASSRIVDTLLSFPAIILAMAVIGALGIGLTNAMIAIGLVFSPILARLVRASALVVRNELYVHAARCFGMPTWQIIMRHILPNSVQPVLVQMTLLLSLALLAEASLSYLGLGVQAPEPSWGGMLARAQTYIALTPEQMYPPGLAILFTALAFNSLGEAVRVALDPTKKQR